MEILSKIFSESKFLSFYPKKLFSKMQFIYYTYTYFLILLLAKKYQTLTTDDTYFKNNTLCDVTMISVLCSLQK